MSMSSDVYGIKAPDANWLKMKQVYDACRAAGVGVPEEVMDFFDDEEPDPAGVTIRLGDHVAVRNYSDEGRRGFAVELAKLPKDLTHLRFVNSW